MAARTLASATTTGAYPMSGIEQMTEMRRLAAAPPAAQLFGNAGREHMERYGTTAEQFAQVAVKNHRHSVNNPLAQFQASTRWTRCSSPRR